MTTAPTIELVWETPEDRIAVLTIAGISVTMTADQLDDLICEAAHVHDLLTCDLAAFIEADCSEQHHEAAVDAELFGGA